MKKMIQGNRTLTSVLAASKKGIQPQIVLMILIIRPKTTYWKKMTVFKKLNQERWTRMLYISRH